MKNNNIEEKAQKNRDAVKKCMSQKDRLNVILPLGTIERINNLGYSGNSFARDLILNQLDILEKNKKT